MLGDSADYSEWKNGRRATGLIYSAGTFYSKNRQWICRSSRFGCVSKLWIRWHGSIHHKSFITRYATVNELDPCWLCLCGRYFNAVLPVGL